VLVNALSLIVLSPGVGDAAAPARTIELPFDGTIRVGRGSHCDLNLPDRRVSADHARIVAEDGVLFVEDSGSRNGTWILDRASGDPRRIPAGERVRIESGATLAVGPYRIVPCEPLDDDVVLAPVSEAGEPGTLSDAADVGPPGAESLAWRSACRLLEGGLGTDPWQAVIDALGSLCHASRGFLLAVVDERLVLRARLGPHTADPACLSERLLRLAIEERRPRATRPRDADATPSGAGLFSTTFRPHSDVRVIAAPFLVGGERPVAVAHLEQGGTASFVGGKALATFGRLIAPLLEATQALEDERRRREAAELSFARDRAVVVEGASSEPSARLVGESPAFRAAVSAVDVAAASDATILLRGPSGTGKEELARLAHEGGPRRDKPFVVVNGAAIPDGLVESELFGHDKGAFTGADASRAGLFEKADGGTLFLDEVGDLPLEAQAKILRVIEAGEVMRIGGTRRRVDVRLVAATHRHLEEMIARGEFREDLYFRLRVIEISLPPLAERGEDVVLLAESFLARFRRHDGTRISGLSHAAVRAFLRYDWPGNVRELRNVIERAVVLDSDGILDLDDLPADLAEGRGSDRPPADSLGELAAMGWQDARRAFEEEYFTRLLEACEGKVGEAARRARVDRRTISTKIREHGLKKGESSEG
jgi:DNA-binding NtrC family response regulator